MTHHASASQAGVHDSDTKYVTQQDHDIVLHECRGASGLLYLPLELTTPERHVAQAFLLQHEAQLEKEAFNSCFESAQAAKADLIALVEEKAARVAAIEMELGLSSSARATTSALVTHISDSHHLPW